MAIAARVEIDEESFRQADAFLARLPLELRQKVFDKAMRRAASPVEKLARRLAPDSVKSGSRKKWSKKVQQSRQGTAQHRQSIGHSTVRHYGHITAIYVGPRWPQGNLINIIGHEHQEVWWGKKTGRTLPAHKYLEQAGEQTKAQQQAAFVAEVQQETEKILASA